MSAPSKMPSFLENANSLWIHPLELAVGEGKKETKGIGLLPKSPLIEQRILGNAHLLKDKG